MWTVVFIERRLFAMTQQRIVYIRIKGYDKPKQDAELIVSKTNETFKITKISEISV